MLVEGQAITAVRDRVDRAHQARCPRLSPSGHMFPEVKEEPLVFALRRYLLDSSHSTRGRGIVRSGSLRQLAVVYSKRA